MPIDFLQFTSQEEPRKLSTTISVSLASEEPRNEIP